MRQRLAERRKAVAGVLASAVALAVVIVTGNELSVEATSAVGLVASAIVGLIVHEVPNAPSA